MSCISSISMESNRITEFMYYFIFSPKNLNSKKVIINLNFFSIPTSKSSVTIMQFTWHFACEFHHLILWKYACRCFCTMCHKAQVKNWCFDCKTLHQFQVARAEINWIHTHTYHIVCVHMCNMYESGYHERAFVADWLTSKN